MLARAWSISLAFLDLPLLVAMDRFSSCLLIWAAISLAFSKVSISPKSMLRVVRESSPP